MVGKLDANNFAAIGVAQSFVPGSNILSRGQATQVAWGSFGHGMSAASPAVIFSRDSGPVNYSEFASFDVGTYLLVRSNFTEVIVVTSLFNSAENLHAVSAYELPPSNGDGSTLEPAKGNPDGSLHPGTGPVLNTSAIPVQTTELQSHQVPQGGMDSANVAIAMQPSITKMPTIAIVNQAIATAVHETAFWNTGGVVEQATAIIVNETPLVEHILVANLQAIGNAQQSAGNHKATVAGLSHADDTAQWPVQKASLVGMPLNIKGVELALEKVMGELGHLGTAFSSWLDARHLTGAAVVFTVVTVGGGTAIYLRRRSSKQGQKRDDEEASSSWLFARLQSAPDAS